MQDRPLMPLWLRARAAHLLVPAGLASLALLAVLLRDSTAMLPSLNLGAAEIVLMMYAPIPLAATLLLMLDSRLPGPEASGGRRIAVWDAGLVAAVMAAAVALCALLGLLLDSDGVLSAARNAPFLAGLALCARPFAGQAAVMATVVWPVAVAMLGFHGRHDPYPWTVLPEPLGAPHAAAASAVVFLLGLAATARGPRSAS